MKLTRKQRKTLDRITDKALAFVACAVWSAMGLTVIGLAYIVGYTLANK